MPFRRSSALALLMATALLGLASPLSAQDFDPKGRRRPPTPTRPAPKRAPAQPAQPSGDAMIARYLSIVLAQPGAPFPLERLAQLYRQRDGHLRELIIELEKLTAGRDSFAAKLALAGIFRMERRIEDALRLYREAIEDRPQSPAPRLALGELHRGQGELDVARKHYEEALPLLKISEREPTLRVLMTLALDLDDFDAAKRYHGELIRLGQGSFFVRGELARELISRGDHARAEAELRALVQAAAGDSRTLAPALRDLAKVLIEQDKSQEAITNLNRALSLIGRQSGLRRELLEILVEAHRKEGDIQALIAKLEAERSPDLRLLTILGELHEELGDSAEALSAYEKATRAHPRNIEARLRLIRLLHARGDLSRAITEYEALIRLAPEHPAYAFELVETLLLRGERDRALRRLSELERRLSNDPSTLARLVEFYERIDEKAKALALLQKLASSPSRDPSHLIELGSRYWQEGDTKRALETWARIRLMVSNRAEALSILGEVYLDHEMPREALAALREAIQIEPNHIDYQKAYAVALERAATAEGARIAKERYEEALAIWEKLLEGSASDRNLSREARTHIITLWGLLRRMPIEVNKLQRRFTSSQPADLEAGRLLAEAEIRLRKFANAEKTLRRLSELSKGDIDIHLSLERVLVLRRDLEGAIRVLAKLVEIEPRRAREFYGRMAEYAAELYRDEDALRYAERAVSLSPDDAEAHRKLGDLYRKSQKPERAILAYRKAIAKNDRLFTVYFDLAELLLAEGQLDEADQILRRLLRGAMDDELILRAARQSMQLNLLRGTVDSLERELLSMALGNPRKALYRRLLVELYGDTSFSLIRAFHHGSAEEAKEARKELSLLGTRAIKPLVDTLSDERADLQQIAIDILSFAEHQAAGPALFAFATGQGELARREQAMIACGRLRDPSLLPRFEAFLLPKDSRILPFDPVARAAAWAVANIESPRARLVLAALLERGAKEMQAIAALGLASQRDRSRIPALMKLGQAPHAANVARAGAAFALGELGAREAVPLLSSLSHEGDALLRRVSLIALAKLSAEDAKPAIAEALLSEDGKIRRAALDASLLLRGGRHASDGSDDILSLPSAELDIFAMLVRPSPRPSAKALADAFISISEDLRKAVASPLMTKERATVIKEALLARGGEPAFSPFTDNLDALSEDLRRSVEEIADSLAEASIPAFTALSTHPSAEVRIIAMSFLATRPEAQDAVLDALSDHDELVAFATLAALPSNADRKVVAKVAEILALAPAWPHRTRAAEALGRIGRASSDTASSALLEAQRDDPSAFVREAALRALLVVNREAAAEALRDAASQDPEPRLRQAARALLRDAAF